MKIENIKKIKSTVLGLALIGFASFLLLDGVTSDYWILASIFLSGVFFLFTGDGWVVKLQELVFGFLKSKSNNTNDQNPVI